MKPISFPKLTLPDAGSRVAPTLGHPLIDDYLESVHARLRPNSTLAVVYDLKVFFTVIHVKAPNGIAISDEAAAVAAETLAPASTGWRLFQWLVRSVVADPSVVD